MVYVSDFNEIEEEVVTGIFAESFDGEDDEEDEEVDEEEAEEDVE